MEFLRITKNLFIVILIEKRANYFQGIYKKGALFPARVLNRESAPRKYSLSDLQEGADFASRSGLKRSVLASLP